MTTETYDKIEARLIVLAIMTIIVCSASAAYMLATHRCAAPPPTAQTIEISIPMERITTHPAIESVR